MARADQIQKLGLPPMPAANQQANQSAQSQRLMELQQNIQQLAPGMGGPSLAQRAGAEQAQKAGQVNLQTAGQNIQQAQAQAGIAAGQKQLANQQQGFQHSVQLNDEQMKDAERLSNLGSDVRTKILDNQLKFQRTQSGQALLNTRQLLDWAATKAKSSEDLAKYTQTIQQQQNRYAQMLQMANNKIQQTLEQDYLSNKQSLDNQQRKDLAMAKLNAERGLNEQKKKAANSSMMASALGTLGGMVLAGGAVLATGGAAAPALAAAGLGGQIGGNLGNIVQGTK